MPKALLPLKSPQVLQRIIVSIQHHRQPLNPIIANLNNLPER